MKKILLAIIAVLIATTSLFAKVRVISRTPIEESVIVLVLCIDGKRIAVINTYHGVTAVQETQYDVIYDKVIPVKCEEK
jgi:uncharacterized protein YbbC (DUF1343 family)